MEKFTALFQQNTALLQFYMPEFVVNLYGYVFYE